MKDPFLKIGRCVLRLAYSPISAYDLSYLAQDEVVQEAVKGASLYAICQRPQLQFSYLDYNKNRSEILFRIRRIDKEEDKSGSLILPQDFVAPSKEGFWLEALSHKSNHFEGQKTFPLHNLDGIKFWGSDDSFLSWWSPDKLIYCLKHEAIIADGFLPPAYFSEFKVHYIGKAVDEPILKRLGSHEKLQKILTRERPDIADSLPAHEIMVLLFIVSEIQESNAFSLEQVNNMSDEDFEGILNGKLPAIKPVHYRHDIEQLLVNVMQPSYNTIKYITYPKNKTSLMSQNFDGYAYLILEDIILKFKGGKYFGSLDRDNCNLLLVDRNSGPMILAFD